MSGLLFISPHPDDAEFALGGTILKHCKLYPVDIVVMTDGGAAANGTSEQRRIECKKINSMYPNIHYIYMNFGDMEIESSCKAQQRAIVEIIRKRQPGIVIIPSQFDVHPDHIESSKLVERCVEIAGSAKLLEDAGLPYNCKYVASYRFPGKTRLTLDVTPKIYIDVSEVYDEKKNMIQVFESQIKNTKFTKRTDLNTNLLSIIEANDLINGNKIGTKYAEEISLIKGCLSADNLFKILF